MTKTDLYKNALLRSYARLSRASRSIKPDINIRTPHPTWFRYRRELYRHDRVIRSIYALCMRHKVNIGRWPSNR